MANTSAAPPNQFRGNPGPLRRRNEKKQDLLVNSMRHQVRDSMRHPRTRPRHLQYPPHTPPFLSPENARPQKAARRRPPLHGRCDPHAPAQEHIHSHLASPLFAASVTPSTPKTSRGAHPPPSTPREPGWISRTYLSGVPPLRQLDRLPPEDVSTCNWHLKGGLVSYAGRAITSAIVGV